MIKMIVPRTTPAMPAALLILLHTLSVRIFSCDHVSFETYYYRVSSIVLKVVQSHDI